MSNSKSANKHVFDLIKGRHVKFLLTREQYLIMEHHGPRYDLIITRAIEGGIYMPQSSSGDAGTSANKPAKKGGEATGIVQRVLGGIRELPSDIIDGVKWLFSGTKASIVTVLILFSLPLFAMVAKDNYQSGVYKSMLEKHGILEEGEVQNHEVTEPGPAMEPPEPVQPEPVKTQTAVKEDKTKVCIIEPGTPPSCTEL